MLNLMANLENCKIDDNGIKMYLINEKLEKAVWMIDII